MKIRLAKKTSRQNRFHRRRGTALVELALVAPILLALVVGLIDFGLLSRNTLIITNAAREGARAAAVGQTTATIRNRILNNATNILRTDASGNISNGSIAMQSAVDSSTPNYQGWPADNGQTNGVTVGNLVRITVTYTHRSISGLFNRTVVIPVVMRRGA